LDKVYLQRTLHFPDSFGSHPLAVRIENKVREKRGGVKNFLKFCEISKKKTERRKFHPVAFIPHFKLWGMKAECAIR
jgi:hypothetical protein